MILEGYLETCGGALADPSSYKILPKHFHTWFRCQGANSQDLFNEYRLFSMCRVSRLISGSVSTSYLLTYLVTF